MYDGNVPVNLARCFFDEQTVARGCGDELIPAFMCSRTGIVDGRNTLAQGFMDSQCDKMVFVDSDITWELGALVKLAHYPFDFVGGCYRLKNNPEDYPMGWLPDPDGKGLRSNEFGLIECASLPGGFLCLSRAPFQSLIDRFPERAFVRHGKPGFGFFQMPAGLGGTWGEDTFFCKEWRDGGGKIYLDPMPTLTHWNFAPTPYQGNIGKWLSPEEFGRRTEVSKNNSATHNLMQPQRTTTVGASASLSEAPIFSKEKENEQAISAVEISPNPQADDCPQ